MYKVAIHIRSGRANDSDAETLCGVRVHSSKVHGYLSGSTRILKIHNVPKDLLHTVHSCTLSQARQADEPSGVVAYELPPLLPTRPPVRAWDFCDGCWESPRRALYELGRTKL